MEDRKYYELEYQLKGLKLAIENMETAIKRDMVLGLVIEVSYFNEKVRRVLSNIDDLKALERD